MKRKKQDIWVPCKVEGEDGLIGIREVARMTQLPMQAIKLRTFEYGDFPPPFDEGRTFRWWVSEVVEWMDIHSQYLENTEGRKSARNKKLMRSWQHHAEQCWRKHEMLRETPVQ